MAATLPPVTLEEPEDIFIYYLDDKELETPMKYRMSDFLYQHAGDGVFVITLNQPTKLNSMRANFSQEILLVIIHAMKDERCKVLVWTGAGRAFCAGANFGDSTNLVPNGAWEGAVKAGLALPQPDIAMASQTRLMIKLTKPSIGAINGMAVGGGVNVAFTWQDQVYVAENSTFRYPFADLGITPELGSSFLLQKIVGLTRAKQLIQNAEEFSAKQAYEYGLCNEVLPLEQVLPKAVSVARTMAKKPQGGLRQSKRLMNKELVEIIDAYTLDEKNTIAEVFQTPETQKALMALAAKTSKNKAKAKAKL